MPKCLQSEDGKPLPHHTKNKKGIKGDIMMIFLQPQADSESVAFEYGDDSVTVTRGGVSDTFDFKDFKHGDVIENVDEDIVTQLKYNPIIEVARDELGTLYLVLLNSYNPEEKTEEELLEITNPEWREV